MDISTLLDPFAAIQLPLADWANDSMRWLTSNYRSVFQAIKAPVKDLLDFVEDGLRDAPQSLTIIVFSLFAWQVANRAAGLVACAGLIAIGLIGAWDPAMTSFAVLLTAVCLSVLIGLPLGIICSKVNWVWAILRPVLDFMQTNPLFHLSGACHPAVWHRQCAWCNRDCLFRHATADPADKPWTA